MFSVLVCVLHVFLFSCRVAWRFWFREDQKSLKHFLIFACLMWLVEQFGESQGVGSMSIRWRLWLTWSWKTCWSANRSGGKLKLWLSLRRKALWRKRSTTVFGVFCKLMTATRAGANNINTSMARAWAGWISGCLTWRTISDVWISQSFWYILSRSHAAKSAACVNFWKPCWKTQRSTNKNAKSFERKCDGKKWNASCPSAAVRLTICRCQGSTPRLIACVAVWLNFGRFVPRLSGEGW